MAFGESRYHMESDGEDDYDQSRMTSPLPVVDSDSVSSHSSSLSAEPNPPPTYPSTRDMRSSSAQLITQWSREQCAEFISSCGLGQYSNIFAEEAITGESLVNLHHADLKEMGISSIGHRLIILKNIYEVKVKHNIPIDPDSFVPPSVEMEAQDQPASQDDLTRLIRILKERDDRLSKTEAEMAFLREEINRISKENTKLRQDMIPLARIAKEKSPLPIPEAQFARSPMPGLSHKYANKLSLNPSSVSNSSPTMAKGSGSYTDQSYDSRTILVPGSHLPMRPSPSHSPSSHSHHLQPSPTSPAYNPGTGRMPPPHVGWQSADHGPSSAFYGGFPDSHSPVGPTATTPTTAGNPPNSASSATSEIFKSFRVSMDDPCHKVLPLALKRYNIRDDWKQYALYIVHGTESKRVERCLRLNEKPLTLFKQLDKKGQKPMFMLRKITTTPDGKPVPVTQSGMPDGHMVEDF